MGKNKRTKGMNGKQKGKGIIGMASAGISDEAMYRLWDF
jgi:hypothetical protein